MIALRTIGRYAAGDRGVTTAARCELCSALLGDMHRHVIELGQRGVQCACEACAILFTRSDANARIRTIPQRIRKIASFGLTAERWAALGVPVSMAVCYRDSQRGQGVVCYPGPAGMTEGELEPAAWEAVRSALPATLQIEDDVEALLVQGARGVSTLTCYLVPISSAYELVARLRTGWEGFSGGERATREVATFFAELDRKGDSA